VQPKPHEDTSAREQILGDLISYQNNKEDARRSFGKIQERE